MDYYVGENIVVGKGKQCFWNIVVVGVGVIKV